jgi:hypothetical protein
MTRHDDDTSGVLASMRLLITFTVTGVALASTVGLVALVNTWWIVALAVLLLLGATAIVVAVILSELDSDEC